MKKVISKKLIISLVGLIMAVLMVTATTFAWFITFTEVTADGTFKAQTADPSLYISATGAESTYGSSANFAAYTDGTTALKDLTWDGSKLVTKGGVEAVTYTPAVAEPATPAVTGQYFATTLYFRSTSAGTVALRTTGTTPSGVAASGNLPNNFPAYAWDGIVSTNYITGTTYATGDQLKDTRAANAVRVMLDGGTKYIWEPNSAAGYGSGTRNLALDYEYVMTDKTGVALTTGQLVTAPSPTYTGATLRKDAAMTDTLLALSTRVTDTASHNYNYYTGTITISIWLEGLDADCLDAILEDIFSVHLVFTFTASAA